MEPTRNHSFSSHKNRDSVGADIILDQVPAYAESLLEGLFADHGFGLEDVVVMAATLEQLILGSGTTGLATAFSIRNHSTSAALSHEQFNEVLETYVPSGSSEMVRTRMQPRFQQTRNLLRKPCPSGRKSLVSPGERWTVGCMNHVTREIVLEVLSKPSTPLQMAKALWNTSLPVMGIGGSRSARALRRSLLTWIHLVQAASRSPRSTAAPWKVNGASESLRRTCVNWGPWMTPPLGEVLRSSSQITSWLRQTAS